MSDTSSQRAHSSSQLLDPPSLDPAAQSQLDPAVSDRPVRNDAPLPVLRVLHIFGELKFSGAEMMYHAAAGVWQRESIVSDMLSIGERVGIMAAPLEEDGYRIHHIPFSRSPIHLFRVFRFLLHGEYDLTHIHVERANFWYGIASWLAGTRSLVRTVHSVFTFGVPLRRRRSLQRRLLRHLGLATVSISSAVSHNERQAFNNPTVYIPNWFDNRRFVCPSDHERTSAREQLGIPAQAFTVVSVGNCSPCKNHESILNALALLPPQIPLLYLHVGAEETQGTERRLADALHVAGKVRFLGPQRDILPMLHAADVFLMPSTYEGLGCAALEAMAAGVPAILADVPGLRDLAQVSDAIVWTDTSPSSIAEAIHSCSQMSPAQRREMGVRGSVAVHQRFGIQNGAADYARLYRSLTSPTATGLRKREGEPR